jgi:hypothetical protein
LLQKSFSFKNGTNILKDQTKRRESPRKKLGNATPNDYVSSGPRHHSVKGEKHKALNEEKQDWAHPSKTLVVISAFLAPNKISRKEGLDVPK